MIRNILKFFYFQFKYLNSKTTIKSSLVSKKATIGRHVLVNKNTFIDSYSSVGDFSYLNMNCSVENSSIGRFCSIAQGVHIGSYEHIYSNITQHPFWYEPIYGLIKAKPQQDNMTPKKRTVIGDDVWIGLNVIIKEGVTIGIGAVIGAGSVVTKDVPAYEIWACNPARKIKDRFEPKIKELLLESKWTTLSDDKALKKLIPNINMPEKIIKILYDH